MSRGLGFQDADRLTVDEEEVVGEAMALGEPELAHRHPLGGGQVHVVAVLNDPAGALEGGVDQLACFLLGLRLGHGRCETVNGSSAA